MIKKCLKWLCILWLTLLPSFSSAYTQIDWYWVIEATTPDTAVIWNYTYVFNNNWNISTDWLGRFLYWKNNQIGGSYVYNYVYGWIDWKLYFAWLYDWNVELQWFVQTFCKWTNLINCNSYNYSADNFYNTDFNITKVAVWNPAGSSLTSTYWNRPFRICFYNSLDSNYYCSQSAIWNNWWYGYSTLTWSLGFTTLSTIENWNWWGSFFSQLPTYTDNNNTEISDNDYVDYYQNNPNYKFTADMCWIWTTDLSSNYWDNVVFHQWSWYTIYQFYSQLYWNTFKLSDVDTWLNSWLVNFNTFFKWFNRYSDWTPYYVLRYNWIWDLVIDKTNLTNPFTSNKIAYYFMASNICDSVSDCSNISQELAIYCYKSLNMANNTNYNITYDPSQWLVDNVNQWTINKYNSQSYFWSWNLIIDSADWSGTPLDYFSWDVEFTWNIVDYFKQYFNKSKSLFNIDVSNLEFWVLPSYIVAFLLALILFRFLSH